MRCRGSKPDCARCSTFDPGGNVYVDEEEQLATHKISLLDKENGKARWTREGYLHPQCAKDDIMALLQWSFGVDGPPASVQPLLFGVSNATGTPQWSVDLTGKGWVGCSADAERAYSYEQTASSDRTTLNVHATRDGALIWSIPFGAPADSSFDPAHPTPAWITEQLDHLLIMSFSIGHATYLQALELPDGQPGSVRWTLPVPRGLGYFQDGPARIFLDISDGDSTSLVRIYPSDGSAIWTRSGVRTPMQGPYRCGRGWCC